MRRDMRPSLADCVCAGEPELAMAARCLKQQIHVFQPDQAGLQAIAKYGEDDYDTAPITLFYNGVSHYDLMLIDDEAAPTQSKL